MLYLLVGGEDRRRAFVNELVNKQGVTKESIQWIDSYDLDRDEIALSTKVMAQTGLFGDREFFVLKGLASHANVNLALLGDYQGSEHTIIFSEQSLNKKDQKIFEQAGARVEVFELAKKGDQRDGFNIFSLTDAFGRRDRKKVWLLYQEALQNVSPEEVNGVLLWQCKNIASVYATTTTPSGMKYFVYKKTQGFAGNYSLDEILMYMEKFTHAFHNRDRYDEFHLQLERILLSI